MDCDSERIWKMVEKYTPREKAQRRPDSLNLLDNLYNCYIDNCQTCQDKRFRSGVNLLEKLSPALAHVSIVVILHCDEDGYSIMLGGSDDQKEIFLPYEDNEIFTYLDAGEIPPVLLEVLESTNHCHFYNGCLVCEVRNYRLPRRQDEHVTEVDMPFESTLVLLKPSQETILRYVNEVCSSRVCSLEERLAVESKLLLATQPPLCLEPEIDVVCVQNRLHYNKRKYHSLAYKRYIRRQCHAKRAIVHLQSEDKRPSGLQLHLFLNQLKEKRDSTSKKAYLMSVRRRRNTMKLPCELDELAQEVSKYSKSFQSDVKLLIQPRIANDAPTPSQTSIPIPMSIPTETTPTKKSPMEEMMESKNSTSPNKSKPDVIGAPAPKTSSSPGSLFVSLPRSFAQSALTISKKATEQKIAPKVQQKPPVKLRPSVPSVSLNRPHIPGKTTITVISTSSRNPATIPNLPPKLHNPNIALKAGTTSQMGAMPRLKPLEARTLTPPPPMTKAPPPLAMTKPPPLAPPTIPKPQLKSSPSSTPSMPQLHKIQVPTTSSSEKPS